jgi:zinc transport system substrate-binding protein
MRYSQYVQAVYFPLALALLASGCSSSKDEGDAVDGKRFKGDKPVILVVNYPLQYFSERIGGDLIEVRLPAPQDVDPAFWKPDTDTIAAYQDADFILTNGAGYAKWL